MYLNTHGYYHLILECISLNTGLYVYEGKVYPTYPRLARQVGVVPRTLVR